MIEVGLLGSVVVKVDGAPVELSGILEKALLARLSLSPGQDVSQSRLIDDLWGEDPPGNAVGSLHTLVYRLRKALGPAASSICRTDHGYKLDAPSHCVDATRFSHARRPRPPGAGVERAHPRHVVAPCARTLARTAPGGAGQRPLRAASSHGAGSERGSVRWRNGSRPTSPGAPEPSSWQSSKRS